jgi:hypothetical protein
MASKKPVFIIKKKELIKNKIIPVKNKLLIKVRSDEDLYRKYQKTKVNSNEISVTITVCLNNMFFKESGTSLLLWVGSSMTIWKIRSLIFPG